MGFHPGDRIVWHCPSNGENPVRVFQGVIEGLERGFARILISNAVTTLPQSVTVPESQLHPAPVPRKSGPLKAISVDQPAD